MIETNDIVSFRKIVRGHFNGLEKELYRVVETDSKYWGACDLLLESLKTGDQIYTTREGVGLAELKEVNIQLTLF